jgi:hypothetical protein
MAEAIAGGVALPAAGAGADGAGAWLAGWKGDRAACRRLGRGQAAADELGERDAGSLRGGLEVVIEVDRRPRAHVPHFPRVPHLTGLDVPHWRAGTTISDGRTDAGVRG